jgi:hypothetical protein
MNYKYLILLVLLVILLVTLVKNKKELFQNNSNGETDSNKFCDGENDVKYVIFYPRGSDQIRANAKAISCNITRYNTTTGMFEFNQQEKSSILVEVVDTFKIKLTSKVEGIGPVFTGNNWSLMATDNNMMFETGDKKLLIPRKTKTTFTEISYNSLESKFKFRVDNDDTTAKELDISNLKFNRFDIGKNDTTYFKGYIGNLVVDESVITISTKEERSDDDFDKLLNFLLSINPEGFQDYKEEINNRIEHFQSNLERPVNFKTVKMKITEDNELKYIEEKVTQTFNEFEALKDASNAVKLSKVLINIGHKFIKSALTSKMNEYKSLSKLVDIPTVKCRETETLNACFYFDNSVDIDNYKFMNNPIDGSVSIKSKLESFIKQALSADLVKDYLNASEEKLTILNDIKDKMNETLKQLRNRFSDGFFVYYELDYVLNENNYTFMLKKVENSTPNVFLKETPGQEDTSGQVEPSPVVTNPTVTTTAGEMYPDDDFIKRVEDCNINFRAHGASKSACIKKCMDNKNVNNCDFDACFNICEKCENKSYCRWLQDIKQNVVNQACDFDANENNTSPTEFECISLCQQNGNESCSQNICKNTCSRCSNEETCPWVREAREFSSDLRNVDFPSAPIVTGIPGDRKITLKWNIGSTGGAKVEKFIFMVFKTGNHGEGMRVETAINDVENIGGGFYTHTIGTLENDVNYTVSIAAVNRRGLSSMSKPLVLKPFKFTEDIEVENTLESSNIIQMQRDQLVSDIMNKLDKNEYNNLKNEIEEVRKIEESLNKSKGNNLFSQLKKIGNLSLSVNN